MPAFVEEHVDLPHVSADAAIKGRNRRLFGQIALQRQLADFVLAQVHAHDPRALGRESLRRGLADAAGGAGDHAHLVLQARHQAVAK
jgi:hypothetical protein